MLPMQGTRVQSPVRELKSHVLHSVAKKKKIKKFLKIVLIKNKSGY